MLLVSYPELGGEERLPVYVRGIVIDYPQQVAACLKGGDAQILFSAEGTGELILRGTVYELPEGSAVYLSERVRCEFRPKGRTWTVDWLTFGCGIAGCSEMLFLGKDWCLFDVRRREEHRRILQEIYRAVALGKDGGFRASALLYEMLIDLHGEETGTRGRRVSSSEAMGHILAYLNDHYTDDITLEQLCAAAGGLSEQYLCRLFKQTTGMRPMEYMLRRRIGAARVCLEMTALSISEVAVRVGFHNTSYFYRTFRKYVGMSPLAYRQAVTEKAEPGDSF